MPSSVGQEVLIDEIRPFTKAGKTKEFSMAQERTGPKKEEETKYPYSPHEFMVSRGLLSHLSQTAQDELKSLVESGKVKLID
jgi:hypothetical protein